MGYLALIQREKGNEAAAAEWSAKAQKLRLAKEKRIVSDTLPMEWPPTPVVLMPPPPPPAR